MILNFIKNRLSSKNALHSEKDPSRFLTVVYILALSFIALLASVSHMIIVQMTSAQADTSEIVYIAGRQRVTAQQVALHAANYINSGNEEHKKLMENAHFSFKLGHDYLVRGYAEEKTGSFELSPELYKIYFDEPVNLHRQAQDYMTLAERLLRLNSNENKADFLRSYIELSSMATGDLIKGLDVAAQQHQEQALRKITRLTTIQFVIFGVLLLTLFIEAVFIFRPLVTHLRNYSQQLLILALKDPLTSLSNRRAFMQSAEAEISRASRHKTDLCVVISDIDKFKSINDTYGHAAGDEVLKHLSKILQKTFRKEDSIGRIGGEEFAFVLPQTSAEQAMQLIEKLRKKIEKSPCNLEDDSDRPFDLEFTSSFGVASFENKKESLASLMKRADIALYEAKENGRNRVALAKPAEDATLKVV